MLKQIVKYISNQNVSMSQETTPREGDMVMVFNATFNNISAISWRPVSLVEKTGVPGKNHPSAASHLQTLLHNVV